MNDQNNKVGRLEVTTLSKLSGLLVTEDETRLKNLGTQIQLCEE